MSDAQGKVTQILLAIGDGQPDRVRDLLAVIYGELHRMAQRQMAGERPGHTLQATALVHEAYLRLLGDGQVSWQNRAHFFSAAGEAMRRILVEKARRRDAIKRGGGRHRMTLDDHADLPAEANEQAGAVDVLSLNDALSRLEEQDERMATIVKLRFFAELSVDETAAALNLSRRTVIRDWLAAKAWLHHQLSGVSEVDDTRPESGLSDVV